MHTHQIDYKRRSTRGGRPEGSPPQAAPPEQTSEASGFSRQHAPIGLHSLLFNNRLFKTEIIFHDQIILNGVWAIVRHPKLKAVMSYTCVTGIYPRPLF
jgi:hypothetical protein